MGKSATDLKKGDAVFVFYHMSKRCQPVRQYLAVLDPRHGSQRPRTGLSVGFVPARVAEDVAEGAQEVSIEYTWPYFFTERGNTFKPASQEEPWVENYRLGDVKQASDFAAPGPPRGLSPPGSQPELGIIAFRWGGVNRVIAPAQWGHTGSSVSDLFVDSFLDTAVVPRLGNSFEVWTVYVEDSTDLVKLADTAHLVFGPHHPVRRAKHVCGMYFLYPTAFEENCIPNMETGEDSGAAMVDQKSFFRLMKAVERAGIPTRFPHTSGLYEQLASKSWTYVMSVVPHLRVPPTVALPRMLVEQGCGLAAEHALSALQSVKAHQAKLRGEPEPQAPITKGVAKLGFSWEALDVKFWRGRDGLEESLSQLTRMIEISGEMTGQPHDNQSILVQEFCEHDLELRAYMVEGRLEAIIYTKFCRIKENNEFGDFAECFTAEEAASAWMGGDAAALADGERQCREVTDHWLQWIRAQSCEIPAAIRFDYFVGRAGKGKATIWTLEICELGFSMLGEKDLPAKVFGAMLRQCLGESPSSAAREAAAAVEEANSPAPAAQPAAAGATAAAGAEATPKQKASAKGRPSHKGGGKGGGKVAKAAPATASETEPPRIVVTAPHGTPEQRKCAGTYTLQSGTKANGRPLWKHSRGDRWIYCGTDGCWYIGDKDEFRAKFNCYAGYLRNPCASQGMQPTDSPSTWERYDDEAEDWVLDEDSTAMAPPAS
uniref:Uncharacterized protein n=1 Tax=Alexandrium monilatum TaxID=311494 RepID=A0A7S4T0T8_9DINO|mmetsp:Transcript_28342/g.89535  ORF Transcript_28342/g.89535 Transcript_28342/m.89535 type:complete len:714 (+) Transcript_28342:55-2196(+)